MNVVRVEYRRLRSFGNYEHEEVGAVAEVGAEELPDAALASLRGWVDGQLRAAGDVSGLTERRSELEWQVKELEGRLASAGGRWEKAKAFLAAHGLEAGRDFDANDVPF